MTPFTGRESGRRANLESRVINLAAERRLAAACRGNPQLWIARLTAFGLGAASFSAWRVVGEKIFGVNARPGRTACRRDDSRTISGRVDW